MAAAAACQAARAGRGLGAPLRQAQRVAVGARLAFRASPHQASAASWPLRLLAACERRRGGEGAPWCRLCAICAARSCRCAQLATPGEAPAGRRHLRPAAARRGGRRGQAQLASSQQPGSVPDRITCRLPTCPASGPPKATAQAAQQLVLGLWGRHPQSAGLPPRPSACVPIVHRCIFARGTAPAAHGAKKGARSHSNVVPPSELPRPHAAAAKQHRGRALQRSAEQQPAARDAAVKSRLPPPSPPRAVVHMGEDQERSPKRQRLHSEDGAQASAGC